VGHSLAGRGHSDDQLTKAKPLSPGDLLIISKDGAFALGFFSPTNSNKSSYVRIWYHNIPHHTVVWVANHNSPITTPSSKLATVGNQELALSDSEGRIIWTTARGSSTGGAGAAAVLLGSGNFILRSTNDTYICGKAFFEEIRGACAPTD
jgi:hypothetical protein